MGFIRKSKSPSQIDLDKLAADYENGVHHEGRALDALETDFHRYVECRRKAEANRNLWFQGQNEEIALALRDSSPKYSHMSVRNRVILGQTRWGSRPQSKDFADAEQMYSRWAWFYLQCWQAQRANIKQPDNKLPY